MEGARARGLAGQAGWLADGFKASEVDVGSFNFGTTGFRLVDAGGGGVPLEELEVEVSSTENSESESANGEGRKFRGASLGGGTSSTPAKGEGGKLTRAGGPSACRDTRFCGSLGCDCRCGESIRGKGLRRGVAGAVEAVAVVVAVVVAVLAAVAVPAADASVPEGLEGLRLSWAGEILTCQGFLGVALSMFFLS